MNKNRKTIKMPVRYLMNAVLVALLFVALSYLTRNILFLRPTVKARK